MYSPRGWLRRPKGVAGHRTRHLKPEVLRAVLERMPEPGAWKVAVLDDPECADVLLEINRPFMTFDRTNKMIHRGTGVHLGSGRAFAWNGGAAAPRLARQVVQHVQASRPPPGTTEEPPIAALREDAIPPGSGPSGANLGQSCLTANAERRSR